MPVDTTSKLSIMSIEGAIETDFCFAFIIIDSALSSCPRSSHWATRNKFSGMAGTRCRFIAALSG